VNLDLDKIFSAFMMRAAGRASFSGFTDIFATLVESAADVKAMKCSVDEEPLVVVEEIGGKKMLMCPVCLASVELTPELGAMKEEIP